MFDFLEAGLDFPTGAVVLDDLFEGEVEVRRKQRDPLRFAINPDHTNGALKRFKHDNFVIGQYLALFAIEVNRVGSGASFNLFCQRRGATQFAAILFCPPRWCLRRLGGESKREALTRNLERMWQC